ncbi:MAG: replication-relaxation family protein [Planctomycetia bacterium]|nr:replication-relaxation family protein [Planctomycetia bacterium]
MIPYFTVMAQGVILSSRDLALLRLLDVTPLTAAQIRKASVTFDGGPFRDERRVRERMQALCEAGLIRSWSVAIPSGGLMSYFRLRLNGHRAAFPDEIDSPPRTSLSEIAPSRVRHALATADMIVHSLVACHERGVVVQRILGDGRLTLQVGEYRQQPDFHLQLGYGGRTFNFVFEIDNATEPLDSHREHSIRTKILGYEAYQDWVLQLWKESGQEGCRPSFRVVFLTTGIERANHILWLAHDLARNKDRRLIYSSTDHHGHGQPLVNAQPSSRYLREPVRLRPPVAPVPVL